MTFAASTALILFLAANTSFNAFPRLAAILAEDGYMPRQFSFRGDRLAYSWGIVLLAAVAFGLLCGVRRRHARADPALLGRRVRVLHAEPDRHGQALVPGQARRGWRWRAVVNAAGGVLTAVVLVVVVSEKFRDGAYLVVILVPLLVAMMLFIKQQYGRSAPRAGGRRRTSSCAPPHREERVVVPIPGLTRAVVQAINVGRSIERRRPGRLHLRRP